MLKKKKLTKAEVKALLDTGAVVDEKLTPYFQTKYASGKICGNKIFKLADGRYLYRFDPDGFGSNGRGWIYTYDDLMIFVERRIEHEEDIKYKRSSSFANWAYYSKAGPEGLILAAEQLFEDTLKMIGLAPTKEAKYVLKALEAHLRQNNTKIAIKENYYDALVAVCGQLFIDKHGGLWEVQQGGPCVRIKGTLFAPINSVWAWLGDYRRSTLLQEYNSTVRSTAAKIGGFK